MASTSVSAKTVIVAHDMAFVRDRFRTALEAAGHRALAVKSAAELLARVRADLAQIDLIVLDLRLPHAPGVELVRSIRKLDEGKLPILIFSGTIASAEEVRELVHVRRALAGKPHDECGPQHGVRQDLADLGDERQELVAVPPALHPAHEPSGRVLQREVEVRHGSRRLRHRQNLKKKSWRQAESMN
jgi:CheY-like chemotaxis protein